MEEARVAPDQDVGFEPATRSFLAVGRSPYKDILGAENRLDCSAKSGLKKEATCPIGGLPIEAA
jgi:hypothetical protein